jgi:alpha-1,6-mannosyltransferase
LLVFAGRFSREKNIPSLLEGFRLLGARYHLLLVGGERCYRPLPNVTVYPYQGTGHDLACILASCDALVHAGDRETFGLVVAEAMACGVPVIGIDAGAVPELVDEHVGLLVPKADKNLLAEAIAALYERDIHQMGQQARRHVENHYSWDRVLRMLVLHYAQLVGVANPLLEPDHRATA